MSDIQSADIYHATPSQISASKHHRERLERIAAKAIDRPAPPRKSWKERQMEIPIPVTIPLEALPVKYPTVESIISVCAIYFGGTALDIKSARRTKEVIRPRQVAMYLSKVLTPRSFPDIGRRIGDRDHTTALHSFRKIERLIRTDPDLAQDVARIEQHFTPDGPLD